MTCMFDDSVALHYQYTSPFHVLASSSYYLYRHIWFNWKHFGSLKIFYNISSIKSDAIQTFYLTTTSKSLK